MALISSLTPGKPANLTATIISQNAVRNVVTSRGPAEVCDYMIRDESGIVKLTLWNADIQRFKVGMKVVIEDGWVSEFRGRLNVSLGRNGSIRGI